MANPNFLRNENSGLSGESNDGSEFSDADESKVGKANKKKKSTSPEAFRALMPESTTESSKDQSTVKLDLLDYVRRHSVTGDEKVIFSNPARQPKTERVSEDTESDTENNPEAETADDEAGVEVVGDTLDIQEERYVVETLAVERTNTLLAEQGIQPTVETSASVKFMQAISREMSQVSSEVEEKTEQTGEASNAVVKAIETASQRVAAEIVGPEPDEIVVPVESEPSIEVPAVTESSASFPTAEEYDDVDHADITASASQGGGGLPPTHHMFGYAANAGMPPQWHATPGLSNMRQHEDAVAASIVQESSDWVAPALIGGIVGNLIGRRQGRKNAERRLLPEKKKLESQVKTLMATIAAKETQIRSLARASAESSAARPAVRRAEMKQQQTVESHVTGPAARSTEYMPPQLPVNESMSVAAAVHERYATTPRRERAHAQSAEPPKVESAAPKVVSVENMDKKALLEVGAEITIGTGNLRSLYENNQIGEQGLRRLVAEHQKGGDIGHVLKDEMLKYELHFERMDEEAQEKEQQSKEIATAAMHTRIQPVLPGWPASEDYSQPTAPQPAAPPIPSLPTRNVRSSARSTMQPVLVAANIAAVVVLLILLGVFLIIKF
jgi:hypothetical protein